MVMPSTDTVENGSHFERVALPHMSYIYRVTLKLSRSQQMAEDLTQETFLLAMKNFQQLRDETKVKAWLHTIARNLFFRTIKKANKQYLVDFDDISFSIPDISAENETIQREGFSDVMKRQLERLDDKYRLPLLMFALESLTYKEIAQEMHIPIGTVMSRISRGKSFLRKEIQSLDNSMAYVTGA